MLYVIRSKSSLYNGPSFTVFISLLLASGCGGDYLTTDITPDCISTATPFGAGLGTSSDPYRICSVQHLANAQNYLSSSFKQYSDLDLTNDTTLAPIGSATTPFTGTYDGNGHTISNWTYGDTQMSNVGFFGVISGSSSISNLQLVNFNLTGKSKVGLLVGSSDANSSSIQISNCSSSGSVTVDMSATANQAGGLVGYIQSGNVSNSNSSAQISCTQEACGGLVGDLYSSTISSSYATGQVTGTSNRNGGLVGNMANGSTISNSYAIGNIIASDYAGGLVGITGMDTTVQNYIINSYATGSITPTSSQVRSMIFGGLVGYSDRTNISGSYATGNISGSFQLGGLVGVFGSSNPSTLSGSYSTGSITVVGATQFGRIGGLIGKFGGTLSTSYSTSNINVGAYAGSLVGGLIGFDNSTSTTSNCYARGNVTAASSTQVGGLIGQLSGTIVNSYSSGSVSGIPASTGGLIGAKVSGTVTNSYWDTSGYGTSTAGGTGYTTSQMQDQSNFSGWDFTSTWNAPSSGVYPTLR